MTKHVYRLAGLAKGGAAGTGRAWNAGGMADFTEDQMADVVIAHA